MIEAAGGCDSGVPHDDAQAAAWFRKAADQGNTLAQLSLSAMYQKGSGVPQDDVRAHMWFNLAASRAPEAELHQEAVNRRDKVAAKMTPDQIAEAQRMAREWKPTTP